MNEVVIHVKTVTDHSGFDGARRGAKLLAKETVEAGKDAGVSFGKSLTQSVSAASASMGPIIAGAGVVAAPLIGASIAGAVVGGAGIGGVIGGVVLASKDARVQAAGTDLSTRLTSSLNKDAGVFVAPLLKSIDTIGAKFDSLQPKIKSIFDNSSTFLGPLTEGLASGAGKIVSGIADAVAHARPVIDAFSRSFDTVGGAVGEMFSTLADDADEGASAIDDLTGSVESFVKTATGVVHGLAEIHGALDKFDDGIDRGREGIEDFFTKLSGGRAEFDITADGMSIAEARAKDLGVELERGAESGRRMGSGTFEAATGVKAVETAAISSAEGLKAFTEASKEATDKSRGLFDSSTDVAKAIGDVDAAAKENGRTLDVHTEKGQANRDTLSRLARTLRDNYDRYVELNGQGPDTDAVAARNRKSFLDGATALGASRKKADEYAESLLGIPTKKNTAISAATAAAEANVKRLQEHLDDVRSKRINIDIITRYSTDKQDAAMANRGKAHGGVQGAADGATSSDLTWTGENGPELLDLPPGTAVHTAGDSKRIAAARGGDGAAMPVINVYVQGSIRSDRDLVGLIRDEFLNGGFRGLVTQ